MSDLPFGLESKNTFASLSPADLQSLGKRASVAYLSGGTSLNDAIIKLAREYPSISPHQVQRVIEFANQETFSRLFSDNEKYASDKNIEFEVADPSAILLELNNGASPTVMSVPPDEYSSAPVKLAHSNVEADIELASIFGVDLALPGSEMTVKYAQHEDGKIEVLERIFHKEASADPLDRILKVANLVDGVATQPAAPMQAPQPSPQEQMQQMAGGQPEETRASANGDTHNDQMLELQREIELAKKRQELQKVEQQTIDQMNPQGQPGAVTAPLPGGGPPPMGGPGPDAGAAAAPQEMAQQGGPVEMAPEQMPPDQVMPEQVPPAAGAITAPPGAEPTKMGSALVKQAMAHVKSGRPHSDLLLKAASASVSADRVKQATAHRGEYPMANPWGEVIRSKQKLAKLLEDVNYARGKNVELYKEAEARFEKMLAQELHGGANFGEVGHLLAAVNGDRLKTVLASAMPYLIQHGLDPVKAKAASIQYEMEKGASTRTPNLNHPLADAYATLCKLASAIPVLETARSQIKERYDLLDKALQGAMTNASAR
jgi:hypothetical protein